MTDKVKMPDEPEHAAGCGKGSMCDCGYRFEYDDYVTALRQSALAFKERVEALEKEVALINDALDFDPDDRHTIGDMANVGRSLMQALTDCMPDYFYNNSPAEVVCDLINQRDEAEARAEAMAKDYNELIMGVARKWPDETRHQTALRYILEREAPSKDAEPTAAIAQMEGAT